MNAWPLLQRCASGRMRLVALLACMIAVAVAVAIAAPATHPERGAIGAVVFTGIGVSLLWSLWFSRLLLLRIEAHTARMPGLAEAIPAAFGLAMVASVLLPAVVLVVLAGAEPALALAVLVLAAAAALLLAMMPGGVYLGLCFAPLVLLVLAAIVHRFFPGVASLDIGWLFTPKWMPWLALLATLAAAWRWHAIVRRADDLPTSPWRRPVVLAAKPGALWGGFSLADAAQWQGELPDWMWPAGQTGQAGPARPVRAMRAIFGTPFAPLTRRQLALQFGIAAVLLAAMAAGNGFQGEAARVLDGGLIGGLAGGGLVMVGMYGWRLDMLRQRPNAEMAELALLPGWGDAPQARRMVLRAAGAAPMWAIGIGTAVLLGFAAYAGVGAIGLAGLLVAAGGVGLMMLLVGLRPLVGKPMTPVWIIVMVLVTLGLLMASGGAAIRPAWDAAWLGLLAGWAFVYLVGVTGIATELRRFHARPHPFLPG